MRLAMALALFLSMLTTATAARLSLPAVEGAPGGTLDIPVIVDRVENLAGLKLVLTYDAKVLSFEKAAKTRHTASLMHIVNDKKPGLVIIVMAGARGIRGRDIPLLTMRFTINKTVKAPAESVLKITEIQLMSDTLKDIPSQVGAYSVSIAPAGEDTAAGVPAKPVPAQAGPASRNAAVEKDGR